MPLPPTYDIEGSFRVVATREFHSSPNRRRAVARIVIWNAALLFAVCVVPLLMR